MGEAVIGFTAIALLASTVYAFVNFLKYVSAKDWSSVTTQAIAWVAGVAGTMLFAASQLGDFIAWSFQGTGGKTHVLILSQMSLVTQIILGLSAASLLAPFVKVIEAIDGSQTAATPNLLTGEVEVIQPATVVNATVIETAEKRTTAAKRSTRKDE